MRASLFAVFLLTALIQAEPMLAQTDPCLRRTLPVSVANRQGQTVHGLSPNDFKAMMKGKPAKVLSVAANDQPVRVMILLDRSGSMLRSTLIWNEYLEAAEALVSRMPAESVGGVTAFADNILGSTPFSSDAAGLREALSSLSTVPKDLKHIGGGTALWDALVSTAASFDYPRPGDTIYALTDGDDDSSKIRREAAQEILARKRIRLFAISIPPGDERGAGRATRELEEFARATGGNVVKVTRKFGGSSALMKDQSGKATEEAGWLGSQFEQIFEFYRVEIELPEFTKRPSGA